MRKGKFIVIEGIDGSGKSELASWLNGVISRSVKTWEPGSSELEDTIRELFNRSEGPPKPDVMTLLFTADRLLHMEQTIKPALESGIHVICDRHKLSTKIYQSINGADEVLLRACLDITQLDPDLTIILDVDPEIARERMQTKNLDSYESDLERQKLMRQMYTKESYWCGGYKLIETSNMSAEAVKLKALSYVREVIDV
jgi:dTMP kinase